MSENKRKQNKHIRFPFFLEPTPAKISVGAMWTSGETDTNDTYGDILTMVHGWCHGELQLSGSRTLCNGDSRLQSSSPSQIADNAREETSKQLTLFRNGGHKEKGVAQLLKASWMAHLDGDEAEQKKRRVFQRQQSLSSLEGTGAGSLDHLKVLSLEQLQEMERMVHSHDAQYWEDEADQGTLLSSLDWLDYICT